MGALKAGSLVHWKVKDDLKMTWLALRVREPEFEVETSRKTEDEEEERSSQPRN